MLSILFLSVLTVSAVAGRLSPRDDLTATVDLSSSRGAPQHLASGFIYGIPDNYPNQIPDHWYTDIDFNYGRAGGAQLTALPNGSTARGWIYGTADCEGRLESAALNYEVSREFGAGFVLLPHDIWGTDGANSSTVWPGDDGDWSDYQTYVDTLLDGLVDRNMLDGLVIDIWNEPDISTFWPTDLGVQRWVDLYIMTHNMIRADSRFDDVLISGPTLASRPEASNEWWTTWLDQIAGNDTVPDQWAYHLEGATTDDTNDPEYTNASLSALLETYGLPGRPTNINEYAVYGEQIPSGYAWWIARLERYDFLGLLGNWQSGTTLHDLFANLLTKTADPDDYAATDYAAAPGYWVYRYYAQNMTGKRLATTGSADAWLDVYATADADTSRLLVGTKTQTGTWSVQLDSLSALGYATDGSVTISTWGFDGSDPLAPQAAPTFRNTVEHDYTDDTLTFPIFQTDNYTAWAFEFAVLS